LPGVRGVCDSDEGDNAGMAVERASGESGQRISTATATGRAALADGRWSDARNAFEAALALGPDPEALDGLGEVMWWLGEPRRSLECRQAAYAEFRRTGDTVAAIMAGLGVAVTYESNFGNRAAAGGWVARAERLLTGDDDPLSGWVWMTKAYVSSDPGAAVRLCERSLAAARRLGDIDLELCSLSGIGEKLVMSGEVEKGLSLVDEAMAGTLGGECSRLDTVAYVSCDMLVACDLAADVERARQWCQVADAFIQRYGCPFLYARCRTIFGSVLVATGHWDEGEQELLRAIKMSDGGGPAVAADAFARLADLRLRQGRLEEASALLRGREEDVRACFAAATLRLAQGDPAGAVSLLRRRLTDIADGHVASGPLLALLVRARLAEGAIDEAHETMGRLVRLADRHRFAHTAALAAAATAHVSTAMGQLTETVERLETALNLFTKLGLPHDAARVRLDLARALAAARPEAAVAEAESALAAFVRFGATIDADAAAALLRSLGVTPRTGRRSVGELTARERQIVELVAQGLSNPEIAARLHISRKTAAHHVSNVLAKLGARNRAEAVALASRQRA
jgi:DNA-binding CsgD family transcriptional regulator